MIASRTIQHNGDRTNDISFILLSHNEEMNKKWDLEISNEETESKIRIYVKNWARQALFKNFDYGKKVNDQWSKSTVG